MTDALNIPIRITLLVLLITGLGQVAMADDNNLEISNKNTIQAAFDAWRNGTGSVFDLLAPDASWTIVGNSPVSRTFNSKQQFMGVVITPFNKRLSKPCGLRYAAFTRTAIRSSPCLTQKPQR